MLGFLLKHYFFMAIRAFFSVW